MAAVLDVLTRLSVPPPGARPGSGPATIVASTLVCAAAFLLLHATGAALPASKRLKRKDAIASHGGRPYHITRRGLELVRSQVDNR